jgi:hypothetical protein
LKPDRVHELIKHAQEYSTQRLANDASKERKEPKSSPARLYVSTSYGGGTVPRQNVVRTADFLLMHGNGVKDPARIAEMVRQARNVSGFRPMPIVINEDDHFDFDKPTNNFTAAIGEYCSWGYFDPGVSNYKDGYQCPPVNWEISTDRKKAFFNLVKEISGD